MAQTVHLFLKANGVDVIGDSTQTALGREGSIECLRYEEGVTTVRDIVGAPNATGRRQYAPLLIRKRIDRSSPLILKALTQNVPIEGTFKFYRPSPSGDGTTEQFYTVVIKQGRVASVKQIVLDTTDAATSGEPPLEDVTFVFRFISWTWNDGGITHEDASGM